jgi:hypothetical protein
VKLRAQLVWPRRDDREAAYPFACRGAPVLAKTGQSHEVPISEGDRIRLLPGRGLLPLIEVIDRNETAPPLEGLAEGRLAHDPLGFGVDVREADFDVLGPERYEPPAHDIQAALASSRIVADHGERVGRRDVPAGRDVRGRPIRRDREDELDLADIGGETGTTTHGPSIAGPGRRPKRIGRIPCASRQAGIGIDLVCAASAPDDQPQLGLPRHRLARPTKGRGPSMVSTDHEWLQRVESGCGAVAVGWACLFPPLSSGGALVARP